MGSVLSMFLIKKNHTTIFIASMVLKMHFFYDLTLSYHSDSDMYFCCSRVQIRIHITYPTIEDVFKIIRDIIQSVSTFCQNGRTFIMIRNEMDIRSFVSMVCGRMSKTDLPDIRHIGWLRMDIRPI